MDVLGFVTVTVLTIWFLFFRGTSGMAVKRPGMVVNNVPKQS